MSLSCTVFTHATLLAWVLAVIVCLSVCVSFTRLYCVKTAKHRITQSHEIAQGLKFSDANSRWWTTPDPPEICAQSDPPLSKTTVSTNIHS